MSIVHRHQCKIRGKPVHIRFRSKAPRGWAPGDLGLCRTWRDGFVIDVRLDQKPQDVLETLLHELTHAAFWDIGEEAVDEACADIIRVLWRLGMRLPPPP